VRAGRREERIGRRDRTPRLPKSEDGRAGTVSSEVDRVDGVCNVVAVGDAGRGLDGAVVARRGVEVVVDTQTNFGQVHL
jgi:predicted phage gp36 major capsid-like protein